MGTIGHRRSFDRVTRLGVVVGRTHKMNIRKPLLIAASAIALSVSAFAAVTSGLKPGESITPFHPSHVAGPLAGTDKCFPCTYQSRPQVQVWVNGDNAENVSKIAKALDASMAKNEKKEFKAMIVMLVDKNNKDEVKKAAKEKAKAANLKHVAIALLDRNDEAVKKYKVNLDDEVMNTVFVYRNWRIADTMVNLKADEKGLASLNGAINRVIG